MKANFIEELQWRGMIHNIMPDTEKQLEKEMTTAYVGIDPTADSLHIGHLVSIMMLKHLQLAGHKPIVLIGGATGMIGDPSGKSQERNLLDEKTLRHNQECIKKQLSKFLDFDASSSNSAELVNNYDWMQQYSFIDFIREVGKHITVNYMMAKDSVKKRIVGEEGAGLSFTEFSYQLVQGTDFWHLYKTKGCRLQMGGSDQWGNIVTGTELIRRKEQGEAYAITCPLITKADGGKFGKTETGNIWLSSEYTSPYKFYQFWLNTSDEDAEKYIKIFTILGQEEVEQLIATHRQEPHLRVLQKRLAEEVTVMIHGKDQLTTAQQASEILFGKNTSDILKTIDETTFLDVFEGVEVYSVGRKVFDKSVDVIDLLAEKANVFASKGELRRLIKGGGVSINKEKIINEGLLLQEKDLLNNKYLLIQKGKKTYYIIKIN